MRHALRLMARQKTFTAAAILTLALGVGATTAIFSIVYGVLLRPLPYPNADRLVRLSEEHPGGRSIVPVPMLSNVTLHAWQGHAQTLEGVAAYSGRDHTLIDGGGAARLAGVAVSPELFALLGVQPAAGRLLQPQDAREDAPGAVVLAHGTWLDRFGGDPSAVGRAITLDGRPFTIVGVAPPDFFFPNRSARIWTAYRVPRLATDTATPRVSVFSAVGLLRPGRTAAQAAAEGTSAARSVGPRHPSADLLFGEGGPVTVRARPLLEDMTARVRPALVVMLAAVGLVLLVACANVANLLLTRGAARGRELAVRAAVGAGRARLVRQLVSEAFVLTAAGAALGVAVGWTVVRALPAFAPADLPRLADVRLDGTALAFAVASSLAAGLLAGVLPAMRVTHGRLLAPLRDGAGGTAASPARRLGAALLVVEAALTLVLLVGAGLLGLSFARLMAVDPGYRPRHALVGVVHLPDHEAANAQGAASGARRAMIAQQLLDRLRAEPGVVDAGASSMAPFAPNTMVQLITLRGDAGGPITARVLAYVVTPGYGEALGLRVLQGRLFTAGDLSAGVRPIIVNEEFVRAHLAGGGPAVGRRFRHPFDEKVDVEIVGVVANVLKDGLDAAPQAEIYNLPQDPYGLPSFLNVTIRTAGDPASLAGTLREAVRQIEPAAAVDRVATLEQRVADSVSEPRFAAVVLTAFALLALALAAVGLYGVISYQVTQRRRELGVRAALGARRASLVWLVVRQGMLVTVGGLVLGAAAAAWLGRLLQGLLFGVGPHDATVFAGAGGVLIGVAAVATFLPARRAASIDPADVLRAE